jgi:branched-subunit amino acid transport protein
MSLLAVVLLGLGIAAQRLVGLFLLGQEVERRPTLRRLANLLPAAIIAAVLAQLTFATGRNLTIDARVAGVAAGAVLEWRGQSLFAVVLGAAAVTAGLRLLGVP